MKKIIVIGCPGSGKSVFSKQLHQITKIPLFHLDMLYWNSDKTTVEKPVFIKRLLQAMETDAWIIDGNYASTVDLRLQHCDTVFFLDYPTEICLAGVRARKGKSRSDMPWVEPDEDDREFIEFIKNYNKDCRPKMMDLLRKHASKEIHIFKSRKEVDEFLAQLQ